jgi:ABC-type phosphate transport system substrate-binding protein
MKRAALVVVALFPLLARGASSVPVSFKVIVNRANETDTLKKHDLSAIFLKKKVKWNSGAPIIPVDQSADSPLRENFSTTVHNRGTEAVKTYWQQQIFSGRNVPPPSKKSDGDVIEFVKSHPNAIGYVSITAVTTAVKVLPMED